MAVLRCLSLLLLWAAAESARPNVILMFADDLGYGDCGFTGHPDTRTPTLDRLAYEGRVLTNWYSGCPVCSGSRAALMTGRQFTRIGVPGVFGPTVNVGLPTNETTLADVMKGAGYRTAMFGKWHLGQRSMHLPASRGFDQYLGIPYSDDMGSARASPCTSGAADSVPPSSGLAIEAEQWFAPYLAAGLCDDTEATAPADPAGDFLPLVAQNSSATRVLEQPLDFTTLAAKYRNFGRDFISAGGQDPFFLYAAFSHVHTTDSKQPQKQYASCMWRNQTKRGAFGDALAEVDWIAEGLVDAVKEAGLEKSTLIIFASDNGPWMIQGSSGGSVGLLYGRNSSYWNVGKGSTWEGGIREPAFAHWPGTIDAHTRTAETVSSLDVLPTLAALVDVSLPGNRTFDGKDARSVLFDDDGGTSPHSALFFYGGAKCKGVNGPSAARYGRYKVHFATGPGLSGCDGCEVECHCAEPQSDESCRPLVFDVMTDPSEAYPLSKTDAEYGAILPGIIAAYRTELANFTWGTLVPEPDGPGEGPGEYGVCCDRTRGCNCD